MKQGSTIVIDPVTRIEGHSKITLHLNEDGRVEDARFHVTQFRGFEKLCEGRPFYEMPSLMARICGICPVSHLIASAKACDSLLAVRIPPTADKLRRIFGLAQVTQSHALSLFHLSSPDLLFGMDADPTKSNIFGVAEANKELALDGIRLRQFGQKIIERLGGKRVMGPEEIMGMVVLGSFVGEEDASVYVWIRRFESEAERKRLYDAVYQSDYWKNEIAPKVPTLIDREQIKVTRIVATPRSVIQWPRRSALGRCGDEAGDDGPIPARHTPPRGCCRGRCRSTRRSSPWRRCGADRKRRRSARRCARAAGS